MTDDPVAHDRGLDALLLLAAQDRPDTPPDFMARVLADAHAAQPVSRVAVVAPRPGLWQRLLVPLGGGFGLTGLGVAAVSGLMIGYVQPESLVVLAEGAGLSDSIISLDLGYGFDALLAEDFAQ